MPAIKERAHALQLLARRHGRRIATVAAGLLALVLTAMFGPTVLVTVRLSLAVRSASPARIRSAVDAANALPNHLKPRNARHARITLFELGSSAVRRAMASKDLDELYAAARMCEIAFVNRYLVDAEIARVIKKRDDAAAALKAMEEARTVAAAAAARYADEEDAILAVSSDEALPAVSDGFSSEASARIAQVKNYLEPLEFQPDGWGAAATYRGETLRVLVAAEEEGGAGATEDAAAEEDAVKDAAGEYGRGRRGRRCRRRKRKRRFGGGGDSHSRESADGRRGQQRNECYGCPATRALRGCFTSWLWCSAHCGGFRVCWLLASRWPIGCMCYAVGDRRRILCRCTSVDIQERWIRYPPRS